MRNKALFFGLLLAGSVTLPHIATSQTRPVLLRDSFPIGEGGGVLCQVQDRSAEDPARQSSFDRAWAVVCRDSALPVANVHAFRGANRDVADLVAPHRRESVECSGEISSVSSGISKETCRVSGSDLEWSVFRAERGGFSYLAEGYGAYDDATLLALRSVLDNRIARGMIDAATTSVNDPLAFARVQAETLKPEQALVEGYRRNLGGEYAEAAAYFETLQFRVERERDETIHPSEFLLNRALQKSNLGEFAEAERLFREAGEISGGDIVGERLQRNFEAIHLLNRGRPEEVAERLAQPLSAGVDGVDVRGENVAITIPIADRLNASSRGGLVSMSTGSKLTLRERAQIIDAQALQIAGTAQRLQGQTDAAEASLISAMRQAIAVRDGRVTTIVRLRSQIFGDLARLEEDAGNIAQAEDYLRRGLLLVQTQYPERRAESAAQARLAAFLLRNGREAEGIALYDEIVTRSLARNNGATGFANQLTPYFRHLASRSESDPTAAARFFRAAQLLVRPGVAETQAVFARELSGGSDEAARLFRQATNLSREIEQRRIRYLQLVRADQGGETVRRANEVAQEIEALETAQARTQAALAEFPQYRVLANRAIDLGEFQSLLQPGEAYARLAQSGPDLFMIYVTADAAKVWRVALSQEDLDFHVDMLRASIVLEEGGRFVTYPYDMGNARALYSALFGEVEADLASVDHLIFEPDAAMLRLPIDLLVTDDASVQAYERQASADPYDFTNVAWLGRGRRISTAVSAQGFVDARRAPASIASREYLGLGENVPVGEVVPASARAVVASGSEQCGWSISNWNRPIDDRELQVARSVVGEGASQVQTGQAFTDSNITSRGDLDEFRILHFATHGLVTPPRPECSVQPALLTSFGDGSSDGLLSFDEIFDLDLDADLVILSACDTAAGASIEATREAGLTSGGGTSLDGLVRAFVGAGGRTVLASHWPAPDDFNATERLMSTMFTAGETMSLGRALKASQQALMDDPATSHPYYWSGFALIGDGEKALLRTAGRASSSAAAE